MTRISIWLLCTIIANVSWAQNSRDIQYYQNLAQHSHPTLKQNDNNKHSLSLQNKLTKIQYNKPQINFTSNVLFSPTFLDGRKILSFSSDYTTQPLFGYDRSAAGYTFYASQVVITQSLLTKKAVHANIAPNVVLEQSLDLSNQQLIHEINKNVSDQYILIYQIQQEIKFTQSVIEKVNERLNVVKELVKKGILAESDFLQLKMAALEQTNFIEQLKAQEISIFGQLNLLCNIDDSVLYNLEKPNISLSVPVKEFQLVQKYKSDSTYQDMLQKASNAKYLPQLSIYTTTGYLGTKIATIQQDLGFSFGADLIIPIYDGKQRGVNEQLSNIEKLNLKIAKDYDVSQKISSLSSLLRQITSTKKSLTLIDEQLTAHEVLLNMLKDKLVIGQSSITDYIMSLEEYTSTIQKRTRMEADILLLINQYNYLNW